ncbi:hypothetical protein GN244_ATG06067 [Phytophthora infestans]|uniref:Uncharacterized protein n=1 Tax=Phytophthora infestans TaxID=4787 RepID=A0A833WH18_PHYIN|nr:hypothetical protein GN244_ATG06067 [Phytophthora infestans]KAF4145721.1 hypothetical protein GN958_ATG05088 [Phytophthora infestans]
MAADTTATDDHDHGGSGYDRHHDNSVDTTPTTMMNSAMTVLVTEEYDDPAFIPLGSTRFADADYTV